MSHFRDHADAMRVIGATFAGHALFAQPCQSWMVRRVLVPETGEPLPPAPDHIVTSSAYHFVVTWLPGRALIVTGDIGETVYSGITHLASLDDTVRLVRDASMDYLTGKSTHKREFDREATARHIIERAYAEMRGSFDPNSLKVREDRLMCRIVDWYEGSIHGAPITEHDADQRKDACRSLVNSEGLDEVDFGVITEDWECISRSWPAAAHWHYEALRTWADLMTRQKVQAHIAAARRAGAEVPS